MLLLNYSFGHLDNGAGFRQASLGDRKGFDAGYAVRRMRYLLA